MFARPPIILRGGHTFGRQAGKILNDAFGKNLSTRDWGRALEALKRDNNLPPNHHGNIDANGNYLGPNGQTFGNLGDYVPGGIITIGGSGGLYCNGDDCA